MKNLLTSKEWKEFLIDEIFRVKIGNNIDGNKVDKAKGCDAYITRKESNNGLDGFIDAEDEFKNTDFPVITIGNETAEPFVQTYSFFTGTKVNILKPRFDNATRNILLFISQCIKRHKNKYSYSYAINSTRLKKQIILLPVKNGNPDYEFMEAYMQEKESELLEQYRKHAKTLAGTITQIEPLSNKDWKEFFIKDLFILVQGKSKGLNHLKTHNNGINYLGATNLNNGVLCQVENTAKIVQQGNCIAFIRNGEGSMGYAVYKAENCIATSDISLGYNANLNRYNGMFITTIADRIRGKYNFGYKRSGTRLSKESLLLPVTNNGEPDFLYMEQYMKRIESEQLTKYLTYINKRK